MKPFSTVQSEQLVLDCNTWNYITECQEMSSLSFKYVNYKPFTYKCLSVSLSLSLYIYIYKQDSALNNLQMWYVIKPTQSFFARRETFFFQVGRKWIWMRFKSRNKLMNCLTNNRIILSQFGCKVNLQQLKKFNRRKISFNYFPVIKLVKKKDDSCQ